MSPEELTELRAKIIGSMAMTGDQMYEYNAMEVRRAVLHWRVKRAQEIFHQLLEPWIKELAHITSCEPPAPVQLKDGRVFKYVGPVPEWKGPLGP